MSAIKGEVAPRGVARRARAPRSTAASLRRSGADFVPPLTISRREFVAGGVDEEFRNIIYGMVLGLQRLAACRDAFGIQLGLTGSQFAVLIGVAYRQGSDGVAIKDLADHVLLAATHVTTEVGRLARKGLLAKRANNSDRRSVLVCLTPRGEAAVQAVAPVVRAVNDILFRDVEVPDLKTAGRVLRQVARNGDDALPLARASARCPASRPLPARAGPGSSRSA